MGSNILYNRLATTFQFLRACSALESAELTSMSSTGVVNSSSVLPTLQEVWKGNNNLISFKDLDYFMFGVYGEYFNYSN